MRLGFILRLLLLFLAGSAWAQSPQNGVLTPDQFTAELESRTRAIEELRARPEKASTLLQTIPEKWIVALPNGKQIETSSEFLRDGLGKFLKSEPKQRPSIVDSLSTRLSAMRDQVIASEAQLVVSADAHQRLEAILSAREFRSIKGPNKLQLWRDQVLAWIQAQFAKWGKRMPSSEQAGPIFAWILIAIASSFTAVWLYRQAREVEAEVRREIIPFAPSDKGWRSWLNEARQCAAQEQWRDAIHMAFWAAVSKLETEGMWRPDRARTPREYLRAIPSDSATRQTFAAIMRSFERAWYAGQEASSADFSSVLVELEKIGCQ